MFIKSYKKLAVVGILPVLGMFVSVSRKDDPNSLGFIGGKVDDGESIEAALIRETLEETGLHVEIDTDYGYPFSKIDDDYKVYCYILKLKDIAHAQVSEAETGLVRIVSKQDLIEKTKYTSYNETAFKYFGF